MAFDDFYTDPFDKFMRNWQRDQARNNNLPNMGGPSAGVHIPPTRPHGLNASEKEQLSGLQAREKRLQPIDAGAMGSRRIPGNPYSIDDRGLLSGLGGLAEGIINKKREQRLGDFLPELSRLNAKKTAAKKAKNEAPQKETPNPLNSTYVEQGMRLISQGLTKAGIKALEKGGLDQSGILEALPKETQKTADTRAPSSAEGTESAHKTSESTEQKNEQVHQKANQTESAATNLRGQRIKNIKKAGVLPPDMGVSLDEAQDGSLIFP